MSMYKDSCQEVLYEDIQFGSKIVDMKNKNIKNGNVTHFNEINLCNMSGGYVMIIALISDCISLYPDTLFIDSMLSTKMSVSDMGITSTSGYVLLACAKLKKMMLKMAKHGVIRIFLWRVHVNRTSLVVVSLILIHQFTITRLETRLILQ